MKTYLYEECRTCLVNACCSNVCKGYRKHIRETFDFNILANPVSLWWCERIMATRPDILKGTCVRTIGPSTVVTKGIV